MDTEGWIEYWVGHGINLERKEQKIQMLEEANIL